MKSSLVTRNIRIHERRTSVRLEPQLWRALETIAELEKTDLNGLCSHVEATRGPDGGFTSALRVFIVEYFGGEALSSNRAPAQPEDPHRVSPPFMRAAATPPASRIDASEERIRILRQVKRRLAG